MPQPPPVSVSNTLLRSYTGLSFHRQALALYSQMHAFDHLTFTFAAKACAGLRLRRHGRAVHGRALAAGFGGDAYVQNALVSMYMRCRDVVAAEAVFGALRSRTTVSRHSSSASSPLASAPLPAFVFFAVVTRMSKGIHVFLVLFSRGKESI